MQFYHQRFPSSALINGSIYKLKNLYRIKGCGPLATSASDCIYIFNEIHAIVGQMPNCSEFSMQFYHQRFPSSALTDRSIYRQRNLFRINGWRPLVTSAQVCIYKFKEIHAIVAEMINWTEFSMQFYHQRYRTTHSVTYRLIHSKTTSE